MLIKKLWGIFLGNLDTDDSRSMIFANPEQLKYLSTSTKWFIDATFRVVQYPFHQLITIHASVSSSLNTVLYQLC